MSACWRSSTAPREYTLSLIGGTANNAQPALDSMKVWLIRNNTAVMGVLLLVFGAKLLAEGAQGLLG